MPRGRALILVVTLATASLALGLAGACASFGTENETMPQATDAQTEAAEAESGTPADVPFCQRFDAAPIFCTDFSASEPAAGWNGNFAIDGGVVARTEEAFTSNPSALEVSAPAANGDEASLADLQVALDLSAVASLAIRFQVRPEDEGAFGSASPFVMYVGFRAGGLDTYDQALSIGLDGVVFVQIPRPDGGAIAGQTADFIAPPLPIKTWTPVVIRMPVGGPGEISIQVGAINKTVASVPAVLEPHRAAIFTLGLISPGKPTMGLRYRFDDVAITAD